jgi:hypothetical protein
MGSPAGLIWLLLEPDKFSFCLKWVAKSAAPVHFFGMRLLQAAISANRHRLKPISGM